MTTYTPREIVKIIAAAFVVGLICYLFNQLPTINNGVPFTNPIIVTGIGALLGAAIMILMDPATNQPKENEPEKASGKPNRYLPDWVKQEVLERQKGTCANCTQTAFLEFHKKIPVSRGGRRDDPDNVVALCPDHHTAAHRLEEGR